MGSRFRRTLLKLAATAALGAAAFPSSAQEWPSQPIRLVVPYAAGGTTDLIARRLGERLGHELGQPVIVENRPGAGTNVGAAYVANAKPDGYTLLLGSIFQVLNPVFGPDPHFDLFTGLQPVSLVANVPFVLAANPKTPYGSGKELVAAAKAAPNKLSVSHAQLDVSLELLNSKANMQLLLVPYKGGGPATTDAIAGEVNMVFALVPVLLPHIQSGKLKPLAVTSVRRFEGLPNVPTFVESGVDFDMTMWYGLFTPAGVPQAVTERLASATRKIMTSKETDYWQGVAKAIPKLVQKQ